MYLLYLIIVVSMHKAAFPLISIVMIASVYGLQVSFSSLLSAAGNRVLMHVQAIIFLIKREFMLIGWMVVYIAS